MLVRAVVDAVGPTALVAAGAALLLLGLYVGDVDAVHAGTETTPGDDRLLDRRSATAALAAVGVVLSAAGLAAGAGLPLLPVATLCVGATLVGYGAVTGAAAARAGRDGGVVAARRRRAAATGLLGVLTVGVGGLVAAGVPDRLALAALAVAGAATALVVASGVTTDDA